MTTLCFNSTLVRLQLALICSMACSEFMFQFHTGSITAGLTRLMILRLKLVSIPHWFDYSRILCRFVIARGYVSIPHWFDYSQLWIGTPKHSSWFQFHTGSITALRLILSIFSLYQFQFHTGSITADFTFLVAVRYCSFNSTLVRLQLVHVNGDCQDLSLFQFHTGSITASLYAP